MKSSIAPSEVQFTIPSANVYREQFLMQQKHEGSGIPPVLAEFSQRMGVLMEKAVSSEEFADALFEPLKSCAKANPEALIQARSICAINALRLGKLYPKSLHSQAADLQKTLPPDVLDYVQAMGD